ncbi:MAG: DUF58 domain-containing protein [Zavarzinella sp.]
MLLILFAVLLGALILQAGLIAFFMYILLGVFLTSRWLTKRWIASLKVKRQWKITGPVELGAEVTIQLDIHNRGTIPIGWVLVEDLFPESFLRMRPPRVRIKSRRIKLCSIPTGGVRHLKYTIICERRGYFQLGPVLLETGDLFGMHRRHRVVAPPYYLMVLPKVVPLPHYNFSSQRPIGELNSAHRLFEDPTRNAGVRPYQWGDPLQRVHWRATARTGELQCKIYEPTTLTGATLLIDFHQSNFAARREPFTSDLITTVAASLAYAVVMENQQLGLVSNAKDAAELYRFQKIDQEGGDDVEVGFISREQARTAVEAAEIIDRLEPMHVPTRRGIEQITLVREALARMELTDEMTLPRLLAETTHRLPRDATVIAIVADISVDSSIALGNLKRQGFAVSVIIVGLEDPEEKLIAQGRLLAEGIRDVRQIGSEEELATLGDQAPAQGTNPYQLAVNLT